MEAEALINVSSIAEPKKTLENMRIGETVNAPHFQRASLETTRARIKNECAKRYKFYKKDKDGIANHYYFTIKRIR